VSARRTSAVLYALTVAALAYAFLSPFVGEAPSVSAHHLAHGFIIVVAGVWGVRRAWRDDPNRRARRLPLLLGGVLAAVVAAALMALDAGTWLDSHRWLHMAMHMALMLLGGAAGLWGERFRRGAGPLFVTAMGVMCLVAATGFASP
jgi:peptidoglycan biosynthesis protein MviN/MurJ (putative lipid II flippase)